ncbi:hypothetical protein DSO57_1019808 [Entomophthora muscae]|uniref:Uncharacterized protein n=1 Tax=Entomophthora muscae TaxID=34485 RepID=A0ACC2S606_9FUNG|nr:hypothetical protein DSO57_1019808 [Entomophthora muscae]
MQEIKIINKVNVSKLVDMMTPETMFDLSSKAFYYASKSLAQIPERLCLSSPEHKLLVMPSLITRQGEIVKLVGIPLSSNGLSSSSVVLSPTTGSLEFVLNSEAITAIRTASGSALITKAINLDSPKVLLIFGSGLQAYWHIKILLKVLPSIDKVIIFSRSSASAERLVLSIKPEFATTCFSFGQLGDLGQSDKPSSELKSTLNMADIICSCTPSEIPFIYGSLLKEGVHMNCIGSYTPDMQEFDLETVKNSTIFVDSVKMVLKEAGEIIHAKESIPSLELLELGHFVAIHNSDQKESFTLDTDKIQEAIRRKGRKFTLFKSVGIATQDLTLTCQICTMAEQHNLYDKVLF